MLNLLPHLLNGITLGLLFSLIALGFMLILGLMEQINLAHGSLFALGAYFAYALCAARLPLPPDWLAVWAARAADLALCRGGGAGADPGRAVRTDPRTPDAPDLWPRSALRPVADLRRRHGASRN